MTFGVLQVAVRTAGGTNVGVLRTPTYRCKVGSRSSRKDSSTRRSRNAPHLILARVNVDANYVKYEVAASSGFTRRAQRARRGSTGWVGRSRNYTAVLADRV